MQVQPYICTMFVSLSLIEALHAVLSGICGIKFN